jgi:hypothetical protein
VDGCPRQEAGSGFFEQETRLRRPNRKST